MGTRGEIFSTRHITDKRTYFFNVKENRVGSNFLTIVESRKTEGEFERQQIMVYPEDIDGFLAELERAVSSLRSADLDEQRAAHPRPDLAREEPSRPPREPRSYESRNDGGRRDSYQPRSGRDSGQHRRESGSGFGREGGSAPGRDSRPAYGREGGPSPRREGGSYERRDSRPGERSGNYSHDRRDSPPAHHERRDSRDAYREPSGSHKPYADQGKNRGSSYIPRTNSGGRGAPAGNRESFATRAYTPSRGDNSPARSSGAPRFPRERDDGPKNPMMKGKIVKAKVIRKPRVETQETHDEEF